MAGAGHRGPPVAPHAGAWIETTTPRTSANQWIWSRLTQARGLKREIARQLFRADHVAPHAGAWIETGSTARPVSISSVAPHAGAWIETAHVAARCCPSWSRLTQARGLKHLPYFSSAIFTRSRLTQARGLKRFSFPDHVPVQEVAPHAGAWIETVDELKSRNLDVVAPHAGAWIETCPAIRSIW